MATCTGCGATFEPDPDPAKRTFFRSPSTGTVWPQCPKCSGVAQSQQASYPTSRVPGQQASPDKK